MRAYTNPRAVRRGDGTLTSSQRNPCAKRLNRAVDIISTGCSEPYSQPWPHHQLANRMAATIADLGLKPVFLQRSENPDVYETVLNVVDDTTECCAGGWWYKPRCATIFCLCGPIPPFTLPPTKRFSKVRMVNAVESYDIVQPVMCTCFMAWPASEVGFSGPRSLPTTTRWPLPMPATEYQTHYLSLAYTPAKA
jgi:hypothetical protein